jgi:signal transduction histidine kinase
MTSEPEMFALAVTPEMTERISRLVDDLLSLLKQRTPQPEEAFIVLDIVMRKLVDEHGMFILSPIDETNTGHT